jgi:hypothetical protein
MKRPPLCALLLALLLASPLRAACGDSTTPLAWVDALRGREGLPGLEEDALLSATAALWARALADAGVLSHRGADGSTALDRYRRAGGTDERVGEILGAGPGLEEIGRAWEASPSHRGAVLRPYWTHAGWGCAPRVGGGLVCVVLFCRRLVRDLRIEEGPAGARVSGSFVPAGAGAPVLLAGGSRVPASGWDPGGRAFEFLLPAAGARGYFRLGYEDRAGIFVLTDAFTLPRETGSPAATGRFEAPAARP